MKADTKARRRSAACVSGMLTGLAAPSLLISGDLEVLRPRKISTMNDAWQNVGRIIRGSAEQYKDRHGSRDDKR